MTQKWNLQDIRPAQPRKRRSDANINATIEETQRPQEVERDDAQETMSIHIVDGNKKQNKSLFVAVVIFLLVVGGALLASAFMGGAEVTVHPIHKEPNLNAQFEAKRVPQTNELAFEIMTLDAEGERQVKAAGEEEVIEQAKGTIFIYNAQQKDPLRLVTNTRFEAADGKIFKIKDSAIVPGYTEADGKKVPGVTTAEVYADQPGEEYNIAPGKFTVPGFKGEPEYANIYGESTETFTGGFNGKKFKIEDAELQTAQQALQTELRNSLLERVYAEKPAGFIMFKDAVTFTYESLPSVAYGENLATIKEKVNLRIPIFKDEDLAVFLARQTITTYNGESVRITDPNVLTFAYVDPLMSTSDISALAEISFTVSGKPQIVWKYDSEKLKTDLLNKPKTALSTVLGAYPAIERATAEIRPFWKTKFPTNIKEVSITEVIDGQE
jgi:hypothetical protein